MKNKQSHPKNPTKNFVDQENEVIGINLNHNFAKNIEDPDMYYYKNVIEGMDGRKSDEKKSKIKSLSVIFFVTQTKGYY